MRHPARIVLTALSWGLLVGACGGGGGDSPDFYVGSYWMAHLQTYAGTTDHDHVVTNWGRYTSDGAGGVSLVLESAAGSSIEASGGYTLGDDHRLAIRVGARHEEGGLEALGRCAVMHRLDDGRYTGLVLHLARQGAFDDGTLEGTYHLAGAGLRLGWQRWFQALSGSRVTFDGEGGYTATPVTVCELGLFYEETPASGLSYEVAPDGELILDDPAGHARLHGGVLAGGGVAMACGGDDLDADMTLYALIRAGTGLSAQRLYGNYWAVAIERTAEGFRTDSGTLTCDGLGTCWFAGQSSRDGVIGTAPAYEGSFAVAADGALTLTVGDGTTLVGGLSQDAQILAVAGGTAQGDTPRLLLAVAMDFGASR